MYGPHVGVPLSCLVPSMPISGRERHDPGLPMDHASPKTLELTLDFLFDFRYRLFCRVIRAVSPLEKRYGKPRRHGAFAGLLNAAFALDTKSHNILDASVAQAAGKTKIGLECISLLECQWEEDYSYDAIPPRCGRNPIATWVGHERTRCFWNEPFILAL